MNETAKAVSQAGKLKPHIRLSRAISEFGGALNSIDSGSRVVFKNIQSVSRPTEAHDVLRLTEELNRDGSRLHKAWKPYGTRLMAFLEQIRVFSKAGDVLVGGSQNIVAWGVWAVIRISLQIVIGHLDLFDKLSLLWMRLGRSSLIYDDTVSLFPAAQDLQNIMCEYLVVVVEFCHQIALFTSKRTIMQLKSQFMTSTNKTFQDFEDKLKSWSGPMEQKLEYLRTRSQLNLEKAAISTRDDVTVIFKKLSQLRNTERRLELRRRLAPLQDDFDREWRRLRRKGSVKWILDDEIYLSWRDNPASCTLAITGKLGSGKSVLMANIVADLHAMDKIRPIAAGGQNLSHSAGLPVVASFFSPDQRTPSLSSDDVLGSLAYQLIHGCGDDIVNKFLPALPRKATHRSWTKMEDILPPNRHYFVVVDVLEECGPEVVQEVLHSLTHAVGRVSSLHVCVSSRANSALRYLLRPHGFHTSVSMSATAMADELASFITTEVDRRNLIWNMPGQWPDVVKEILNKGSQGMYLWAILQLERILPTHKGLVTTVSDIIKILEDLPTDLHEAFRHALDGVNDRRYGNRIFQLVASAKRPLTGQELRVALNVQPGVTAWDNSTLALDSVSVVVGCGGALLEIDEEFETVHFIHHSALRFLLRDNKDDGPISNRGTDVHPLSFTWNHADWYMGSVCATYLHFPDFERQVAVRSKPLPSNLVMSTLRSATMSQSALAKAMTSLLWRRRESSTDADLSRIVANIARLDQFQDDSVIGSFVDYAQRYWLHHTARSNFNESPRIKALITNLLSSTSPVGNGGPKPWEESASDNAMEWALRNGHVLLFQSLPKPPVWK